MMKISVITPTDERKDFLEGTYSLLKGQRFSNWEWLIYDTSLRKTPFSDPRICYIHDDNIVSIGEKRNRLIEKASGDVIVHFDDDDYYAPSYLDTVIDALKSASFFTTHAWFSYDLKTDQVFYWDTEEFSEVNYCLNALSGSSVREIALGPKLQNYRERLNYKGKAGYGFSFAYTKELALSCRFQDVDIAEDRLFYEEAEHKGFIIKTAAEQKAELIHVIHDTNTSTEFPQYRIPKFVLQSLSPSFFAYLKNLKSS